MGLGNLSWVRNFERSVETASMVTQSWACAFGVGCTSGHSARPSVTVVEQFESEVKQPTVVHP